MERKNTTIYVWRMKKEGKKPFKMDVEKTNDVVCCLFVVVVVGIYNFQ